MAAHEVELCGLIVSGLTADAGDFSQTFSIVRGHIPRDQFKSLTEDPRVIVAPGGNTRDGGTRGGIVKTIQIHLATLAKLGTGQGSRTTDVDDLTALDALLAFTEDLEEYFVPLNNSVTAFGNYEVRSVRTDPSYDMEQIVKGVFYSVMTIEFELNIL